MNVATVMELVKAKLLITSSVRDEYLKKIIEGVDKELKDEQGLSLNEDDPCHLMFVVDMAAWRYQAQDDKSGMPRHLQFRLHNLLIHNKAGGDTQNG